MMKICGLQKLTLLDYPQKTACTVFIGGCNFRCPFCQNAELISAKTFPPEITKEQLMAFLEKRKNVLDGVCITGGEPLLWPEISTLIRKIKALGYAVKLDTNGSFPELLKELVKEGIIDYVAMDIKNAPSRYAETAGLPLLDIKKIQESVDFLRTGKISYEFRTTVVRELHTKEDLLEIGHWIHGAEKYFLQNFVDSEFVITPGLHGYSAAEMHEFAELLRPDIPHVSVRGI